MAESALWALYQAVYRRLTATEEIWGGRVSPDLAAAGTPRPHVVYQWMGGGEINGLVRQDAEFVLSVKCIAESLEEAMRGAARISALLNDADLGSALELDAGADWYVLNTQQEQVVHLREKVDGRDVYHEGHRFRVRMESK